MHDPYYEIAVLLAEREQINNKLDELKNEVVESTDVELGSSRTDQIGRYKVNVRKGLVYSADFKGLLATGIAIDRLPIRTGYSVNVPHLREIEINDPELYAVIAPFFTAKPSKPSVKVEVTDDERTQ